MKRLKVTRFLQDPCYCAIGSIASVTNYYNPEIDYIYAKKVADKMIKDIGDEGIETGDSCRILNRLGFHKVTVVSSDLDCFDYTWEHYGRRKLTEVLHEASKKKKCEVSKANIKGFYKWYSDRRYNNIIKISFNFGRYIRKHLRRNKPVIANFNWTVFMKFEKEAEKGGLDPINGEAEQHSVVLNGYDSKGVWIVDAHHKYYKYKRKKYRSGFYKMSWENFFTCMGMGDIILPEDYYIEE